MSRERLNQATVQQLLGLREQYAFGFERPGRGECNAHWTLPGAEQCISQPDGDRPRDYIESSFTYRPRAAVRLAVLSSLVATPSAAASGKQPVTHPRKRPRPALAAPKAAPIRVCCTFIIQRVAPTTRTETTGCREKSRNPQTVNDMT
jgi:hypothetical protein